MRLKLTAPVVWGRIAFVQRTVWRRSLGAPVRRTASTQMNETRRVSIGVSVGIGMAIGAGLGVAIKNIALGVGVGAGIGLAVGYLLRLRQGS